MTTINATPHEVTVKALDGDLVHFAKSDVPPIRCIQMYGAKRRPVEGCPSIEAGVYTVDLDTIGKEFMEAETIIVSTIVAASSARIRLHLNKPHLRIIVPDSGPSAKRNDKGQIEHVMQFLEY